VKIFDNGDPRDAMRSYIKHNWRDTLLLWLSSTPSWCKAYANLIKREKCVRESCKC